MFKGFGQMDSLLTIKGHITIRVDQPMLNPYEVPDEEPGQIPFVKEPILENDLLSEPRPVA